MNPLIGFALDQPKYASLSHLECIGFEVDQDEQEPIFRCREGTVFVDGKPASGPRLPIHPPRRHTGLERGLEGRDQMLRFSARRLEKVHFRV